MISTRLLHQYQEDFDALFKIRLEALQVKNSQCGRYALPVETLGSRINLTDIHMTLHGMYLLAALDH